MLNLLPVVINHHAPPTIAQLLRRAVEADLVFLGGVLAIATISTTLLYREKEQGLEGKKGGGGDEGVGV